MKFRSGNFGPKLGKSGKTGFLRGGSKCEIWNFLKFYFFNIFQSTLWVLCQNSSENEPKLSILWHIQFLRVWPENSDFRPTCYAKMAIIFERKHLQPWNRQPGIGLSRKTSEKQQNYVIHEVIHWKRGITYKQSEVLETML